MIYYEEPLYSCENCGQDDLRTSWREIDDPLPTKYYPVLVCYYCGAEHVHADWRPLLRAYYNLKDND